MLTEQEVRVAAQEYGRKMAQARAEKDFSRLAKLVMWLEELVDEAPQDADEVQVMAYEARDQEKARMADVDRTWDWLDKTMEQVRS